MKKQGVFIFLSFVFVIIISALLILIFNRGFYTRQDLSDIIISIIAIPFVCFFAWAIVYAVIFQLFKSEERAFSCALVGAFIAFVIVIVYCSTTAYAHAGRTDAYGGHYDNETGEYHYHCNGNPPHQHNEDGSCPYKETEKAVSEPKSASYSTVTPKPELHIQTPNPLTPTLAPAQRSLSSTSAPVKTDRSSHSVIPVIIVSAIPFIIIFCVTSHYIEKYRSKKQGYEVKVKELVQRKQRLESEYETLKSEYMKKEEHRVSAAWKMLYDVLADKKASNPTMAKVLSDYEWYLTKRVSQHLKTKKNRAPKAAEAVEKFGKRNKELVEKLKKTEYEFENYKVTHPDELSDK